MNMCSVQRFQLLHSLENAPQMNDEDEDALLR